MVRIILLEDNNLEAILFESALQEINYKGIFKKAKASKEFHKILAQQLVVAKKEDVLLIFLDIIMPTDNGLDVLRQLKASVVPENMLIFCLSGLAYDRIINQAYQLGTNAYLFKPTSFDDLVDMLEKLCHFINQYFLRCGYNQKLKKNEIGREIQKLFISKF